MAAIKAVEFTLQGDPTRAKATVEEALVARKFTVAWSDEWSGVAERGSKTKNLLLGAAAQYFKVGVRVMSADTGHAIVRLDRESTGWMGGAIGAARTTKNLEGLRDDLGRTFDAAGVLVGVNQL